MMATHNMSLVSMLEKRVIELDAGRATERKAKSKATKQKEPEAKEEKSKDSK